MNSVSGTKTIPSVPVATPVAPVVPEPKKEKKDKKPKETKPKEEKQQARKRKRNAWVQHVMDFKKEHPELEYKQCMIQAKATYKPVPKPAPVQTRAS